MSCKKVLLTGASGLLGRALYKEFENDASWEILGLAYSRAKGKLRKVDITDSAAVNQVVEEFGPNVIIHSAAERRPDVVEKQAEATQRLNIQATSFICNSAAKAGIPVLYLSTDYVFDGNNPPYSVDAEPKPLNKYGFSKLEGERTVMAISKDNMVLRVPILYGHVESLEESAVTLLFKAVQDIATPSKMCHYQKRFPTLVDDVAVVIKQLLDKRLQDPSLIGIFHWSADECTTKYGMARDMGEIFGISTNHISGNTEPPEGATRPDDAHLDTSRIESLGICKRTPFKEAIKECLQPFLVKPS